MPVKIGVKISIKIKNNNENGSIYNPFHTFLIERLCCRDI